MSILGQAVKGCEAGQRAVHNKVHQDMTALVHRHWPSLRADSSAESDNVVMLAGCISSTLRMVSTQAAYLRPFAGPPPA